MNNLLLTTLIVCHVLFSVFTFGHMANNKKIEAEEKIVIAILTIPFSLGFMSYLYWSWELQSGGNDDN